MSRNLDQWPGIHAVDYSLMMTDASKQAQSVKMVKVEDVERQSYGSVSCGGKSVRLQIWSADVRLSPKPKSGDTQVICGWNRSTMGKRKKSSRGPTGPKKVSSTHLLQCRKVSHVTNIPQREGLATSFKCVFCNNENSVSVKIDKKSAIGTLSCRQCGQQYQTTTNNVYFDWIDACDEVARDQAGTAPAIRELPAYARPAAQSHAHDEKYSEEDGFVVDDEPDAEAAYDDED
nr:transcription elongation factor 1 [Quercus suber]